MHCAIGHSTYFAVLMRFYCLSIRPLGTKKPPANSGGSASHWTPVAPLL